MDLPLEAALSADSDQSDRLPDEISRNLRSNDDQNDLYHDELRFIYTNYHDRRLPFDCFSPLLQSYESLKRFRADFFVNRARTSHLSSFFAALRLRSCHATVFLLCLSSVRSSCCKSSRRSRTAFPFVPDFWCAASNLVDRSSCLSRPKCGSRRSRPVIFRRPRFPAQSRGLNRFASVFPRP